MSSRPETPGLSLRLRQNSTAGSDEVQLNRPSFNGYNNLETTTFNTTRAITLVCGGLDAATNNLYLAAALRSRLLQLVDESSQEAIVLPPAPDNAAAGRIEIAPGHQMLVSLRLDPGAQIWKDVLRPGRAYVLRFSAGGCWRHEYTLEPRNEEGPGGLEALQTGRRYAVELAGQARWGFLVWMVGRKEELLRGTEDEKVERWHAGSRERGEGRIQVMQANQPVVFSAL